MLQHTYIFIMIIFEYLMVHTYIIIKYIIHPPIGWWW
jgi:hypothetical protein